MDLIMNIIKNKNRDEKLENIKKSNIQKCIQWCEKFKIPHNKFLEKGNIFLPENQHKENHHEEKIEFENNIETNVESNVGNEKNNILLEEEKYMNIDYLLEPNMYDNESMIDLEFYANRILEEQINMGIDEYLYEPSLYI